MSGPRTVSNSTIPEPTSTRGKRCCCRYCIPALSRDFARGGRVTVGNGPHVMSEGRNSPGAAGSISLFSRESGSGFFLERICKSDLGNLGEGTHTNLRRGSPFTPNSSSYASVIPRLDTTPADQHTSSPAFPSGLRALNIPRIRTSSTMARTRARTASLSSILS